MVCVAPPLPGERRPGVVAFLLLADRWTFSPLTLICLICSETLYGFACTKTQTMQDTHEDIQMHKVASDILSEQKSVTDAPSIPYQMWLPKTAEFTMGYEQEPLEKTHVFFCFFIGFS